MWHWKQHYLLLSQIIMKRYDELHDSLVHVYFEPSVIRLTLLWRYKPLHLESHNNIEIIT